MKKNFLSILFLVSIQLFSQTALEKKALKDYDRYNYAKAVKEFEAVENKNEVDMRDLADAYLKLHEYEKAETWYATLLSGGKANQNDSVAYIGVLMNNKKYDEATRQMKAFKQKHKKDTRFDTYLEDFNYLQKLAAGDRFKVSNLSINSEQEDFGAVYFNNDVVFASSREGIKSVQRRWNWNQLPFLDIYSAKQMDGGELNELTVFQKSFNKKFHEGPVAFSKNGTLAVFTRNNYEGESSDHIRKLKLAVYEWKEKEWVSTGEFPYNSNEYSVGHGCFNNDGTVMYFASDMPGGKGGVDLYSITRAADGTWGKPVNLGDKINTVGNETFPSFHSTGIFFFASDGQPGFGGLDIFVCQVKDGKFGKVQNVGSPVNSSKDDFHFELNNVMKEGYFSSNREGGKGDDDIYHFNMLKPFSFGKTLKIQTNDKNGTILPNTTVQVRNDKGELIAEVKTDDKGTYSFPLEDGKSYTITCAKNDYIEKTFTVAATGDEPEVKMDVVLEKIPQLSLYALITEGKNGPALEGVAVTITETGTNNPIANFTTGKSGDFRKDLSGKKIGDVLQYTIKIEKSGFLTKEVTFEKTIDKEGAINLHEFLDITLSKPQVGLDLAKMIDIKPIYFDLGKYNIRKDAAIELDKVIKVMNEYPTMVVELGSHTDCRSSAASNMKLSDNRAKASAEYIKKQITNPERIYGKGYGETKLLNGCACEGAVKSTCSEEEHQKNRRTEFIIIKM
jgi:outer membrane protein OmpA-like peptidoglycan-associated protein/tetratricopeptide (TPR) repeat protein